MDPSGLTGNGNDDDNNPIYLSSGQLYGHAAHNFAKLPMWKPGSKESRDFSRGINLIPPVAVATGAYTAATGKDPIVRKPVGFWGRAIAIAGTALAAFDLLTPRDPYPAIEAAKDNATFGNKWLALIQYAKHAKGVVILKGAKIVAKEGGADMPEFAGNFSGYVNAAERFTSGPAARGVREFVRRDGSVVRYSEKTGYIGIKSGNTIRTFFRPDDGIDYYLKEMAK